MIRTLLLLLLILPALPLAADPETPGEPVGTEEAPPAASADRPVRAYVIPITDGEDGQFMVDEGLHLFLRRRLPEVQRDATHIIFVVDTFGGQLKPALDISEMLLRIPESIRTIAFIRHKAISAGALIALSCRERVMEEFGSIGDCQPVQMTPEGADPIEEEKIHSPLRQHFRKLARTNGFPEALGEGMVTQRWIVYAVETDEGTIVMSHKDWEDREREDPAWAEAHLPRRKVLDGEDEILTWGVEESLAYGLVHASAGSLDEVLALYGIPKDRVTHLHPTWSETFVRWLTSPAIASLLMLIGMLAIYMELQQPGIGLPGATALVCFGLVFGAKSFAGLAETWEILVFAIGILLLFVELFFIPGFGLAGVAGIILIVTGLLFAGLPEIPTGGSEIEWWSFKEAVPGAIASSFGSTIGALVLLMLMIHNMDRIPVLRRLILSATLPAEGGYTVGNPEAASLVGMEGTTLTELHPTGKVRIDGKILDVVADGEYIESGATVRVAAARGSRIEVRKA